MPWYLENKRDDVVIDPAFWLAIITALLSVVQQLFMTDESEYSITLILPVSPTVVYSQSKPGSSPVYTIHPKPVLLMGCQRGEQDGLNCLRTTIRCKILSLGARDRVSGFAMKFLGMHASHIYCRSQVN